MLLILPLSFLVEIALVPSIIVSIADDEVGVGVEQAEE